MTKIVPILFRHRQCQSLYNVDVGHYTQEEEEEETIHRRRIQFRSSAPEIWQSCSPSISSNGADDQRCRYGHADIAEEEVAIKKAKRSTEVYLLSDVSVNLRLKLCLPLQDVRLFIQFFLAQNQ